MIIIAFEKGTLLGGYGDRIVGLISAKMIADIQKRKFAILWNKEDVSKYINYRTYDYIILAPVKKITTINCIDRQHALKEHLMTSEKPLPDSVYKMNINMEISQYIYANPKFSGRDFLADIYRLYSTLYTDILPPTTRVSKMINTLMVSTGPVIGIQIRAGDAYIATNPGESHAPIKNPDVNISLFLYGIKKHADAEYGENRYRIFMTSDYENIMQIAGDVWSADRLIYFAEKVQHLDRVNTGEFSKFYIDNYILSQKTNRLYISDYSNYGRIAALSAVHSDVYSLECVKLDKKSLLSKAEMIW